jgi:hypothetical protein
MPSLQKHILIPLDNPLNAADFSSTKIAAILQLYGADPKLGKAFITPDMYVRRLVFIA